MTALNQPLRSQSRRVVRIARRPALRPLLPAFVVIIGACLVVAGVRLPWLTFFAGLQPVSADRTFYGTLLDSAAAMAIIASLAVIATRSRWPGRLVAIIGLATAAFSGYLLVQLAATLRSTDALLVAQPGPGLFVSAIGAAVILVIGIQTAGVRATSAVATSTRSFGGIATAARVVVVATLVVAGAVHLVLAPPHFASSSLLGSGFVVAGMAQLGLAWLALVRPGAIMWRAVVALAVTLLVLYGVSVTVGLPLAAEPGEDPDRTAHAHGAAHVSPQSHVGVESIDPPGVVTKLAELAALGGAVTLLVAGRRSRERPDPRQVVHGPA